MLKFYYPVLISFQGEEVDMNVQYCISNRQAGFLGKRMFDRCANAKTYAVRMITLHPNDALHYLNDSNNRELQ